MGRSTRKHKGTLVHHGSGPPAASRPIVASFGESAAAKPGSAASSEAVSGNDHGNQQPNPRFPKPAADPTKVG